jgi:hypothetical protein
MHSDDTSWEFTNRDPGLGKRPVIFQYLSGINKLHVVYCFRTIFFLYQIETILMRKKYDQFNNKLSTNIVIVKLHNKSTLYAGYF